MEKLILTTLLAIFLLAPQAGLQAAGNQQFLNGKPFSDLNMRIDDLDGKFITQEELDSVNEAIDETNTRIDDQDTRIDDLEKRILALEEAEPPGSSELVFSGDFEMDQIPAEGIVEAWDEFRKNATGSFKSVEISNNKGGRAICSDPVVSAAITLALNSFMPGDPAQEFDCDSRAWHVGVCSSAIELNAGSIGVCQCDGAAVRPSKGSTNWGGIGNTCTAESQTLTVILTR